VLEPSGVVAYDTTGKKTPLRTPPTMWGLAWASNAAVWVTAGNSFTGRAVWLTTPTLPPREVFRDLSALSLQDAAADGRLLVHHGFERVTVRARSPGEQTERELGVFSWSWASDVSDDGNLLLANEGNSPGLWAGPGMAAAYVRSTSGGLPTRLGDGIPLALAPDGKRALVCSFDRRWRFTVTPTGAGESRAVHLDQLGRVLAAWFADATHVVADVAREGQRSRGFLVDFSGTPPRAILPEGIASVRGSYRDGTVIGSAPDGTLARYPVQDGAPEPLPARLLPGSVPLRASGDGRFLFVGREGVPYRIDRVEIASGRKTPWRMLQPDDLAGATQIFTPALSADGEAYAYTYGRYFQDLHLIEGLRP
jgi:hypothetical protein